MTPRAFVVLAVVTAAFVAAAAISVAARLGSAPAAVEEALLFESLIDKVNDVTGMAIRTHEESYTLKRQGDGWVVAEKHDYPALADKVAKALVQLAGLRVIEAKTRMPERYKRLDLEDVESEGAKSRHVRLLDGSGNTLAEIILGRTRQDLGGNPSEGVYVRRPGEEQSWLARGSLTVHGDAVDWMPRRIVDVPAARVSRVVTTTPDGTTLTAYREKSSDKRLETEDIPADAKKTKNAETTVNDMGSALSMLDLADVKPASEVDFASGAVTTTEVHTFDGLVVRVTLMEVDKEVWARFEASSGTAVEPPEKPEDVAKEVVEINARVTGWAYRIQEYKAKFLSTKLADLVETEPPS